MKDNQILGEAQEAFILEWGRMSSSWGINRTMSQIHALLFVTGEPLSMDEICERLSISRGNASMSLRGLIDWGVIRKFRRPGDRRDLYISDLNSIEMVARVLRERKRRELDPTVDVIRSCLEMLPEEGSEKCMQFRQRLQGLLSVLEMVDMAFRFALVTDKRFRQIVEARHELRKVIAAFEPHLEKEL